jgi:hypothetical protein
MKVLWHHADLKNLQNLMTCCTSFKHLVQVQQDWLHIKKEVDHSIKELVYKLSIDALSHQAKTGDKFILGSDRCNREASLK